MQFSEVFTKLNCQKEPKTWDVGSFLLLKVNLVNRVQLFIVQKNTCCQIERKSFFSLWARFTLVLYPQAIHILESSMNDACMALLVPLMYNA